MKKVAIILILVTVMLALVFGSAYAKPPARGWQELDIDSDGQTDYLYLVFSAKVGKEFCWTAQFDNPDHTYAGAEVWFETGGVIEDNFAPANCPFFPEDVYRVLPACP